MFVTGFRWGESGWIRAPEDAFVRLRCSQGCDRLRHGLRRDELFGDGNVLVERVGELRSEAQNNSTEPQNCA
jgi:hypothetical protein